LYDLKSIKSMLKNRLPYKRYIHSLGVCDTAARLAKIHNACMEKAQIAGVLHDYAKYLTEYEARQYIKQFEIIIDEVIDSHIDLAHGLIGAELIKSELKIEDQDILNSIRYHTTGRKHMTKLEKIIYLADYIEPNRKFSGIEKIRKVSEYDLDKAVLMALDNSITHVISKGLLLHNDSILARNTLIMDITITQKSIEVIGCSERA